MINIKRLIIIGMVLLVGVVGLNAQTPSGPPEDAPRRERNRGHQGLVKLLGLSPDQVTKLRELRRSKIEADRAARKRLEEAKGGLDRAIYAEGTSKEEINKRIDEVAAAHGELIRIQAMREFAVRNILTPEQLKKFRELRRRIQKRPRYDGNRNERPRAPKPAPEAKPV